MLKTKRMVSVFALGQMEKPTMDFGRLVISMGKERKLKREKPKMGSGRMGKG